VANYFTLEKETSNLSKTQKTSQHNTVSSTKKYESHLVTKSSYAFINLFFVCEAMKLTLTHNIHQKGLNSYASVHYCVQYGSYYFSDQSKEALINMTDIVTNL